MLPKGIRTRAARLGASTADGHTIAVLEMESGLHVQVDASRLSISDFTARFGSELIRAAEERGRSVAVEALRDLLNVPSREDVDMAVDRIEREIGT